MPQNQLKTISIVFLIIGMLIFVLLGGIPAIYTFLVSTQDHNIFHGLSGSTQVGLDNYRRLTSLPVFPSLFANSLILSIVPSILAVIIALPAAGLVGGMIAGRKRSLATVALLLPAFIPDIVLAFLTISIIPSTTLVNPASIRVILILLSAIRPAAICAFVGACAAGFFKDRGNSTFAGAGTGVIIGIAVNFVRFLTGNLELFVLHNPLVLSTAETFDTFIYRHGLIMFQVSQVSAAWVVRTLPQMLVAVLVSFVVFACVRSGLYDKQAYGYSGEFGTQATGLVPGIIGAVTLVAGLLVPLAFSGSDTMGNLLGSVGSSAIITVLSVVVFGVFMFMLTAWLCVNINNAVALVVTLILAAIVNNTMGVFLFFRYLGLANTYYAVVLANASNIAFVLPLAYLARLRSPNLTSFSNLVRAMLPYFIVFLGLFAAYTWDSSFNQVIFLHQQNYFGVSMLFQMAMTHSVGGAFGPPAGVILGVTLPILAIAAITGIAFVMMDNVTDRTRNV